MWLLDGMAAPSFATFGNFIRDELTSSIEDIFLANKGWSKALLLFLYHLVNTSCQSSDDSLHFQFK